MQNYKAKLTVFLLFSIVRNSFYFGLVNNDIAENKLGRILMQRDSSVIFETANNQIGAAAMNGVFDFNNWKTDSISIFMLNRFCGDGLKIVINNDSFDVQSPFDFPRVDRKLVVPVKKFKKRKEDLMGGMIKIQKADWGLFISEGNSCKLYIGSPLFVVKDLFNRISSLKKKLEDLIIKTSSHKNTSVQDIFDMSMRGIESSINNYTPEKKGEIARMEEYMKIIRWGVYLNMIESDWKKAEVIKRKNKKELLKGGVEILNEIARNLNDRTTNVENILKLDLI